MAARLSSVVVRHVMCGAAPSASDLVERAMQLMPSAEFHHGYGLTKCIGGIAYEPGVCRQRVEGAARAGRVGVPVPDADIRIVEDGRPGKSWVRSPQNIAGYWQRPDADRELYAEEH